MSSGERRIRVGFLLQEVLNGGVDRCFLNLARGFADRGIAVDLVVRHVHEDQAGDIAAGVNVIRIDEPGRCLSGVTAALTTGDTPSVLIAAKEADARLALEIRERLGIPVVLVASLDHTGQLDGRGAGSLRRWARYRALRRLYGAANQVFCVSRGVAEDMAHILRPDAPPLSVLPNPVVTPELHRLASAALDHPWFVDGAPPVVLGVGRLSLIKNFPLLVRAFALMRRDIDAHLVILGDGKQRSALLHLAERLGVSDAVAFPGHVANPYPHMAHASLFVLSSLWEGFGNVLVEALACGTPVVATNCRSGPAEILDDGRYGALVPVGDESALAEAMRRTLHNPPPPDLLRRGSEPYTLQASTDAYLSALGLTPIGRS